MYLKISTSTNPQWNSSGGLIGFTDIYGHIHTPETLTHPLENSGQLEVPLLSVSHVEKHETIAAKINKGTIEPLDPSNKIVFRRLFSREIR